MGAGRTVTAPRSAKPRIPRVATTTAASIAENQTSRSRCRAPGEARGITGELLTVKVRYQPPDISTSRLINVRAGGPRGTCRLHRQLPNSGCASDTAPLVGESTAGAREISRGVTGRVGSRTFGPGRPGGRTPANQELSYWAILNNSVKIFDCH
jgi:hypothetical protein